MRRAKEERRRAGEEPLPGSSPAAETVGPVTGASAERLLRAASAPLSAPPGDILGLQRTLGNRATSQLLGGAQRGRSGEAAGRDNAAGLPAGLRAGVEALSGQSLADVKVHYDSSEAARVGALAYARGSEIHLRRGQEAHLAHEAWHVTQQRQGRVGATGERKGLPVNEDAGLEREADVMGARASALGAALGATAPGAAPPQSVAGQSAAGQSAPAQMKLDPDAKVGDWYRKKEVYYEVIDLARHDDGTATLWLKNATTQAVKEIQTGSRRARRYEKSGSLKEVAEDDELFKEKRSIKQRVGQKAQTKAAPVLAPKKEKIADSEEGVELAELEQKLWEGVNERLPRREERHLAPLRERTGEISDAVNFGLPKLADESIARMERRARGGRPNFREILPQSTAAAVSEKAGQTLLVGGAAVQAALPVVGAVAAAPANFLGTALEQGGKGKTLEASLAKAGAETGTAALVGLVPGYGNVAGFVDMAADGAALATKWEKDSNAAALEALQAISNYVEQMREEAELEKLDIEKIEDFRDFERELHHYIDEYTEKVEQKEERGKGKLLRGKEQGGYDFGQLNSDIEESKESEASEERKEPEARPQSGARQETDFLRLDDMKMAAPARSAAKGQRAAASAAAGKPGLLSSPRQSGKTKRRRKNPDEQDLL